MLIYLRHLGSQFIFLFGAIWALVGTPFLAAGVYEWHSAYALKARGVVSEATIVERTHLSSTRGGSTYRIKYVFHDPKGAEHVREDKVPWEKWRATADGGVVRVRYLPENPDRSRLLDGSSDWVILALIFSLLGTVFAGTGWFLVGLAIERTIRAIGILHTGILVTGTAKGVLIDESTTINGRHPRYLSYSFVGPDGKTYEDESGHLPRGLEKEWAEGSALTIACDPRNPSRHEADILGVRRPADPGRPGVIER